MRCGATPKNPINADVRRSARFEGRLRFGRAADELQAEAEHDGCGPADEKTKATSAYQAVSTQNTVRELLLGVGRRGVEVRWPEFGR
jgi:hypothetical protein